jgi:hypothetical protein
MLVNGWRLTTQRHILMPYPTGDHHEHHHRLHQQPFAGRAPAG